ncbi:S8 family serine peptidase [Novosphingobium sp. G106]|uniref:S8 family peptidase n=1 Tax=Novosphingobium sp. G106 TaxID=2849500 RepID=UPI001C2DD3B9|nr:S8 family serine peptidase [Novosphingobium sp. G106]MBV1691327.1 S8 family serine peptidase [Novosphingobium sp. G106]
MKPWYLLIALCMGLAALCLSPGSVHAQETPNPERPPNAERPKVLVMTRLAPEHFQLNSGYGGAYGTNQARRSRLQLARRIARAHGLTITDDWPMPLIELTCFVMEVPEGRSVEETLSQLASDRDVVLAEPMQVYAARSSPMSYDDPLYRAQPAAGLWKLAALHRISTGRGVPVAVIDSGIEDRHPDLSGQVTVKMNFVTGSTFRAENHGTAVAGIIAAKAGNHLGIVGIAPDARLWGLRACQQDSRATLCDTLSLAKALSYAIDHGAQVINMSLAGPPWRTAGAIARRRLDAQDYDRRRLRPCLARGWISIIAPRRRRSGRGGPTHQPCGHLYGTRP